jgi:hypothetical protein
VNSRTRLLLVVVVACLGFGAITAGAEAAAPAWSPVAATGPTVLPPLQSEVQRLEVQGEGGTFTLGATRNVTLASGTGTYSFLSANVTNVVTESGAFAAGQSIVGEGIKAGTTIKSVGSGTLTLSTTPTCCSTYTETAISSVEQLSGTTSPLPFDASAEEVESALNALPAVSGSGGRVAVEGGPGGSAPYTLRFVGTLADANVEQITVDGTQLTGKAPGAATATVVDGGAGSTELALYNFNVGGFESEGPVTATIHLPSGVTTTGTPTGNGWTCSSGAGQQDISCTSSGTNVAPAVFAQPIHAQITATPGTGSGLITFGVVGGGAGPAVGQLPLTVSATPAEPGIQTFTAGAYDSNGHLDTQAGDHPYSASTGIFVNTIRTSKGIIVPAGEFKDISVDLPPGFLGNPLAVPQCPESTLETECPFSTMVGLALPLLHFGEELGSLTGGGKAAVFNTEAPLGYPGKFRFNVRNVDPLSVVGTLRSESDYGLTAASLNTPQIRPVYGTFFTFWGTPADPSHNSARCTTELFTSRCGPPAPGAPVAFLTNATNCAEQAVSPPITRLRTTLWQVPDKTYVSDVGIPPVTGCDKLAFEGGFEFHPAGTQADSPAAFTTGITVPSEGLTAPSKLTTPELKQTVIRMPRGVTLNASAANGLQACSEQQIGFLGGSFPMPNPMHFNLEPNRCPDAAKIGTGELKTPLIDSPLQGSLYLAAQGDGNPFGSLFAVYLVIEDPRHGIFIKLPGRVDADEGTGQLTATFQDLPQVPFTSLHLNLKGGATSPLATPETCGSYATEAEFTPWSAPESGPPTKLSDPMPINQGPGGSACANAPDQRPFDLGMTAGSADTKAGAHTPFSIRVTRPDGAQEITTLGIHLPKGLTGKLAGIPYCSDDAIADAGRKTGREEQGNASCPSASQVGTTNVGAGAGPSPFYTGGKLYLAGPYKGAPLSVVAITPAVAGPFDLGNVVVRTALFVNKETAQITAKSDPLPQYLKGVQLRIRDVRINLDRSDFMINPTSCEAKSVDLTIDGNSGAVAKPSNRFQVGGCRDLSFEPNLKLRVFGRTKRNAKPRLRAELTTKPGEANISTAQVNLPHSEFLEQNHIKTVCTRVQFAAGDGNGSACPKGSIYGRAKAWTPLLDKPLEGNVYLRSNGGERKLPDLVAALDGQVDITLWGKVDSGPNHGIRNTFEVVPDAPVSRFVLEMFGGRRGLLVNSENLCSRKAKRRAIARFVGQNNKVHKFKPAVRNQCKKHRRHKKHHRRHSRKGHHSHKAKRSQSRVMALVQQVRGGW